MHVELVQGASTMKVIVFGKVHSKIDKDAGMGRKKFAASTRQGSAHSTTMLSLVWIEEVQTRHPRTAELLDYAQ